MMNPRFWKFPSHPAHGRTWLSHVLWIPILCAMATGLRAATTDGALRMEVITAHNFVVDSNIESPAGKSPSAAHLGVKIHNDGPTALTNVEVRIGNLADPASGTGTPGVFQSRTVTVTGSKGYSGTFALQMPGGAADAVRVIPRVEPGKYVAQYFFVTYPLKDGSGNSVTGSAPDPSDDLWLNYDIWASASEGVSMRRVDRRTKVTMRNEISAMANKIWPNTESKVPKKYLDTIESALGWRPGTGEARIAGANVTEGIWYDLGNVGHGFDNNGDGIPDRNAWLQPVGDPNLFSPLAVRMAKCYGIVIVKLNDGTEKLIPFEDRLYFENLPANNTGAIGLVYYEFLPLNAALPSALTPYQEVASGYDNEKFNSDYGTVTSNAVTTTANATIAKTGPATRTLGQNADYVLAATNNGTTQFGWPEIGQPVVIEDPLPTGLEYVAGSAAAGPNTTTPAGGAFTVFYSTNGGSTWSSAEPSPASSVNRLRWVLDRPLASGGTATVRFSATVPTGFSGFNFTNTGILKIGTETEVARDAWTTVLSGNNSVGDFIWRDLNRDGVQNGGAETGIPNIGVSLYLDINGDGLLDPGDALYGTTSTDSSGNYLFSNLPDRKYIVRVDALDPDVPNGFSLKQGVGQNIAVDLDSAGSNPNPVSVLTADWPFIDALEIRKSVSPTMYNEGSLITYTIELENHMSTVAAAQPPVQTRWITSATQNQQAQGVALVGNTTGAPDNAYGFMDWNSNADSITTNGLGTFTATNGTISKVEILIRGYMTRALVNDTLAVNLTINGAAPATNSSFATISTATMNTTVGAPQTLAVDVTGFVAGTWTWAQAQAIRAALTAAKVNNSDNGDFYIDAIGVRVTASTTDISGTAGPNTISPLPLVDSYNPARLQFVEASIQPDSITPAGTLSWVDLGPLHAGARRTLTVTFRALAPTDIDSDGRRDPVTVTNTVSTTNARFLSGLPAGSDESSVNVTVNPRGTIGDFVYWDVNGNGAFDTGDVPLSGVIVQLWQRSGTGYVFTGSTAITDTSGFYAFIGLADVTSSNAFQVRIVTDTANDLYTLPFNSFTTTQLPTGGSATSPAGYASGPDIVLNNSDTITTNDSNLVQDFGFDSNVASLISGRLFRDWNGNGVQDPGDEPLVGFSINLTGGATAGATTDANGFYQFLNITSTGNHTVTVASPPAGHTQTLDPDATFNSNTVVNVVAGNAYTNRNFAYRPTGSLTIGDTVYHDWNGNGAQDAGEGGIPNIDVRLFEDANADGAINAEDSLIATTTTNAGGFYQFSGLASGNYIVQVVTSDPDFPPSFNQTQDYDGIFDNRAKVNLTASLSTVDFGYQPTGTSTIGNQVWLDTNNNGLKDAGEPGVNGVSVQLYRGGQTPGLDTPVNTAITSGGGFYSFTGLPAGQYFIFIPSFNFAPGAALASYPWSSTTTNTSAGLIDNDDNGIQSSPGAAVESPLVTLTSGQNNQTVDFGFTGTGAAGDFVFFDTNGNGSHDYGEPGIPNVTVRIFTDADMDGQPDSETPVASTVTSDGAGNIPAGFYQFTGLVPGFYFIRVDASTLPAGVVYTSDPDRDGVPVGVTPLEPAGDHADSLVPVSIGSAYSGADFGYQPPGAIGDFVWLDLNQNGVADPGEPGLANVEIEISNGGMTITAFTDFDGYWSAIVPDGAWTVTVLSSNFVPGSPLFGMMPTYDADGTGTANVTSIVLAGGELTTPSGLAEGNLGIDSGYRLDGSYGIAGTVLTNDTRILGTADDVDDFYDDGEDMDAGPLDETELAGIAVYLYTQNGVFLGEVLTDEKGRYAFTGLPAGTYRVIIGTTDAPLNTATLTTTVANNPATTAVDSSSGTTVIQTVVIVDSAVERVDFAFIQNGSFDFGDLPISYGITTLSQDGARHLIPNGGSTRWLGSTPPDAETNGQPHLQALSDDLSGDDDEDGVAPVSIQAWTNGTVASGNGGSVQVTVNGSGWLVAWIDWNQDGDFLENGEFVISQAVSQGSSTIQFDIPAGSVTGSSQSWLSRFRLLPEQPAFPLFSYAGEAIDGEVEDYLFEKSVAGSIGDLVWIDTNGNGLIDGNEAGLGGVLVEIRDHQNQLLASQLTSDGTQDVDGDGVVDPVGYYRFRGLGAASYIVAIPSQPFGFAPSYDEDGVGTPAITTVALSSNVQHLTADFGFEPLRASISGQVRFDIDGDGNLLDPDDGAPFVRIQLWTDPNGDGDPSDGVQTAETFTSQDGSYVFNSVPTGKYVVVEINPAGATSTADVDGGNPDRIAVTMVGDDVTGRDFLDTLPTLYTISGTAYEDNDVSNDEQIGNDDYRVAGIWIRLYLDRNGDGLANDGDPEIGAALTDALGFYSFAGLQPGKYVIEQTDPQGAISLWDAQGAPGDNLIAVTITDADAIERDFLDNQALGGISGTVRADTNGDGSADTVLAGVAISLLDASGNAVLDAQNNPRVTTTDAGGFYSFTELAAGSYQIAETQPTGYDSASDKDGGDFNLIGDVELVLVSNGEVNEGNDFLEYLQACPDHWDDWKNKWDTVLNGDTSSGSNPDGDRYNNLIEYAFCLPPHSGVRKPFCLAPSLAVSGAVDGVYRRTAIGGAKDVTYTLEWTAALGNPTNWTGSVTLDANNTVVTNNGNGTETVRISDLETLTGLTAGSGFVRIRVSLDNGSEQATATTEVLGWVQSDFGLCCATFNNPFRECAVFTGTIGGVAGQVLEFDTSAGPIDLGTVLQPGASYYLEIGTGDLAGHRFDVVAASGSTLTLADDNNLHAAAAPFSTLAGALPAALAGDTVSLHRHRTVASLFPPTEFGATGNQATADQVQVFAEGAWTIYWLYDENDADPQTARWVNAADAEMADAGSTVIAPGQGLLFNNRSSAVSLLSYGEVRENDFVRPLALGQSLVGGGFPIVQSPSAAGGRGMTLAAGLFGSRDFKTADSIFVWNADSNPSLPGYTTYYLANGAPVNPSFVHWLKVGDSTAAFREAELLLKRDRAVFVRSKTGVNTYRMPAPWTP